MIRNGEKLGEEGKATENISHSQIKSLSAILGHGGVIAESYS